MSVNVVGIDGEGRMGEVGGKVFEVAVLVREEDTRCLGMVR